jgi:uncharacterized membrane protein
LYNFCAHICHKHFPFTKKSIRCINLEASIKKIKMPPELTVFFTSMIPFAEMKLAIPVGLELGLSMTSTTLFAVAGSIIPAAITLALISPIAEFARQYSIKWDNFLNKLFAKTRKEHTKRFNRYGAIFLMLFIAIPLPGSGTVGASIIAFAFGVNYWRAIALISLGSVGAAMMLTAGFSSIFAILDIFA